MSIGLIGHRQNPEQHNYSIGGIFSNAPKGIIVLFGILSLLMQTSLAGFTEWVTCFGKLGRVKP